MEKFGKKQAFQQFNILGRTKKVIKVGKMSEKDDILTIEENLSRFTDRKSVVC